MPGLVPVCGVIVGEPAIEIGLPAGSKRQIVQGQPVEEDHRAAKVLTSRCKLVVGGIGAPDSVAQPSEQVPDSVAAQQLLLDGVRALGDGLGDTALEPGHLLITVRKRAGRDQHAA
ncbi:hypothetical protein [Kutzneria sp. NPDC052558]|uniref:hypothetical protein n=1 Tax=Kutzneria sp. NPDC052558 TaxID=3364121 RepID=UPI0037C901D2